MESNHKKRHNTGLILLIFFILCSVSEAAFENQAFGVQFAARGSGGFGSPDRSFALFRNPAVAAFHKGGQIELFYQNFYGLKEINMVAMDAGMNLGSFPAGIAVKRFGNNLYAETEAHLVFSMRIMDSLAVGLSINGCFLQIERYGHSAAIGFDLAGFYGIAPGLSLGFLLHNITEPNIGESKERIPGVFCLGISYMPVPSLELNVDAVKESAFAFDYRIGLGYRISKWLQVSGGLKDKTNQFSAGLRINSGLFSFGYALEYHAILGSSNMIGVGYAF